MSLFTPIRDTSRGLRAYTRGVRWLSSHPRYLALLGIPTLVGLVFLVGTFTLFIEHGDAVTAWLIGATPESGTGATFLHYAAGVLIYVAVAGMTLVGSLLLMNIVASPVYEAISVAIEREVTGCEPPKQGARGTLKVIGVELRKVLLIYGISLILLVIPGVNLFAVLVAAFLVGWDFFDYPLARRGWTLRQRLGLVTKEFWAILGLGIWLVIPFAQIILLPMAVAGGTLLNLEALQARQLLTFGAREKVDAPR